MPYGYNSLNEISVNDFALGMCPVCCRRLAAECEHRTAESEEWYAAQILAENLLASEKYQSKLIADPRTVKDIEFDEMAADWEAQKTELR